MVGSLTDVFHVLFMVGLDLLEGCDLKFKVRLRAIVIRWHEVVINFHGLESLRVDFSVNVVTVNRWILFFVMQLQGLEPPNRNKRDHQNYKHQNRKGKQPDVAGRCWHMPMLPDDVRGFWCFFDLDIFSEKLHQWDLLLVGCPVVTLLFFKRDKCGDRSLQGVKQTHLLLGFFLMVRAIWYRVWFVRKFLMLVLVVVWIFSFVDFLKSLLYLISTCFRNWSFIFKFCEKVVLQLNHFLVFLGFQQLTSFFEHFDDFLVVVSHADLANPALVTIGHIFVLECKVIAHLDSLLEFLFQVDF